MGVVFSRPRCSHLDFDSHSFSAMYLIGIEKEKYALHCVHSFSTSLVLSVSVTISLNTLYTIFGINCFIPVENYL